MVFLYSHKENIGSSSHFFYDFLYPILDKSEPKYNSIIELNNLLSDSISIKDISIEKLQEISEKYNVNMIIKYKNDLYDIYRKYLVYCLKDNLLSDKEITDLSHLKHMFHIEDDKIREIHNDVTFDIFSNSVEKVVSDGNLSEKEKKFLNKLQTNLSIPDEIAKQIYSEKSSSYLQNRLENAISDERLSPDEERKLNIIAQNLGVTIEFDNKTKNLLDKYKLFWLIENGEIPEIEVDILIHKKEKCHFSTNASWYEYRKTTNRIRYSGPSMRIKLAKGLYWRAGEMGVQAISSDNLTLIDNGRLLLTNKRIIFIGNKNTKTIKYNKIIDITPHSNGIEIIKDSGKSPFLEFDDDIDVFSIIISRLIRET